MDSYNIADGKARFSELVARAEAGEEIEIRRRGEAVAKIVAVKKPRKKIDIEEMRRISQMSPPEPPRADGKSFVEWMRDTDRY